MFSANHLIGFGANTPTSVDIITNHTSATSASGTASASTENATRVAWKAFDGTSAAIGTDAWQATTSTGWLKYALAAAKTVTSYKLTAIAADDGANVNRAPATWTFEASSTGAFAGEQVTLDTQTSVAAWSVSEQRTYNIVNDTPWLYYSINITADQGGAGLEVAELRLIGY